MWATTADAGVVTTTSTDRDDVHIPVPMPHPGALAVSVSAVVAAGSLAWTSVAFGAHLAAVALLLELFRSGAMARSEADPRG